MRLTAWVALGLTVVSCAPMVRVTRDVPPHYVLEAQNISVVARNTSGSVALDVIGTILDPLGALNRVAVITPRAAERVGATLARSGFFRMLGNCAPAGCPGSQAVLFVRMVDGDRTNITSSSDKTARFRGTCRLELTIQNPDGSIAYQDTARGSVEGPNDVVLEAAYEAADRLAGQLLPAMESTTFTLAEKGPLSGAAKLAAKGNIDVAAQQFLSYVTANPNDAEGRFHLAAVLTAKGDLEGAAEQMHYAEQLNPQKYGGEAEQARQRIVSRDAMQRYLRSRGR